MEDHRDTQAQDRTGPSLFDQFKEFFNNYYRLILVVTLALASLLVAASLPPDVLARVIGGLLANRSLVTLLLFFSAVTLSLLWTAGQRIDAQVFLFFNQHKLRRAWLDGLMWVITNIGSGLFAVLLAGVFYLLDLRRLGFEIVLGTLTLWLVVEILKTITGRPRPFISLSQTRVVGLRAIGRSFPSGHTSQTFFLISLLIHHFEIGLLGSLLLYTLALLVGFTRVYIGVHYPRDVLGGAILGAVWGILMAIVDPYLISWFFS